MEDFQMLTDFGNLYNSCQVSLKGKGKKLSAAKFNVMALEYLYVIKKQLLNRTYRFRRIQSLLLPNLKEELSSRVLFVIKFYNIVYVIMFSYQR